MESIIQVNKKQRTAIQDQKKITPTPTPFPFHQLSKISTF